MLPLGNFHPRFRHSRLAGHGHLVCHVMDPSMPLGCNAGRLVVVDVLREGREGREEESVNASCLVLYIYICAREHQNNPFHHSLCRILRLNPCHRHQGGVEERDFTQPSPTKFPPLLPPHLVLNPSVLTKGVLQVLKVLVAIHVFALQFSKLDLAHLKRKEREGRGGREGVSIL